MIGCCGDSTVDGRDLVGIDDDKDDINTEKLRFINGSKPKVRSVFDM